MVAARRARLRKDRDVERERTVAPELVLDPGEQPRHVFVERADLQVVANAEVEGQPRGRLPVILDVAGVHLHRDVRVGRQRVRVQSRPRRAIVGVVRRVFRERPAAERRAGVVAFERDVAEVESQLPLVRPSEGVRQVREVVFQLPARLRTHLRVAAAPNRNRGIGEDGRAQRQPRCEVPRRPVAMTVRRRHLVLRVRVLETEIIQGASAEDGRVADHRRPARHRKIEARARRRAPARRDDRTVLVLRAVAEKHALRRRQLVIELDVVGPSLLRALERAFVLRPQAARVHGQELVLLRPLVREEVMRPVLHERPADRAAVLIPPVIRLRRLKVFRRRDRRVAEEQQARPVKLVRARLGDDRQHTAGREPVFRLVG